MLTDAAVRKYKPEAERREIPDGRLGLYLVIQPKPTGTKSWAMRFRRPNGDPAKLTLGKVLIKGKNDKEPAGEPILGGALTLAQARVLAARIQTDRARDADVIEDFKAGKLRKRATAKEQAENTFGAALPEFFVRHKIKRWSTRPRRWRGNAALLGLSWKIGDDPAKTEPTIIKGSLAATWADKPLSSIDAHDIQAVVDEAWKRADSRARKLHSGLSTFFKWATLRRKIPTNPCQDIDHPGPPRARKRVLNETEIVWFWKAADAVDERFRAVLQLLLLTGCRHKEVCGMSDSELDGPKWTIPGERTKNHLEHSIILPPLALEIIKTVPRIENDPRNDRLIFTTTGKRPISGWSKVKQQLDERILELAREAAKATGRDPSKVVWQTYDEHGKPVHADAVEPWRLHDLRRTMASGLQGLGIRTEVIERCLNHISGSYRGVAGTYQQNPLTNEVKAALLRWSQHVAGLTSGSTGKVLKLRKRARS